MSPLAHALAFSLALAMGGDLSGCSAQDGRVDVVDRPLEPVRFDPTRVGRILLDGDAIVTAVWMTREGEGVAALSDARFVTVDVSARVTPIDRLPGEIAADDEAPVHRLAPRGPSEALALVPGGAIVLQHGLARRAPLPDFLRAPRDFTPFGAEALWATDAGLFASDGPRWVRLDTAQGPVTDAQTVLSYGPRGGPREAWVHAGTTLRRVRFEPLPSPSVTWIDPTPGASPGVVRSVARMDDERVAMITDRGVTVSAPGALRLTHADGAHGVPTAIGAGGGWAWVVWGTELLRTDGGRWQSLVTDPGLRGTSHLAVDEATGASALLALPAGGLMRVEAEPVLRLSGLSDASVVLDSRLELEAIAPYDQRFETVEFRLAGDPGALITQRNTAPWGWGPDGARVRDLGGLTFGPHLVEITARTTSGITLRRTVRFDYVSPLGRTPSYAQDIAPLFAARCARCHGAASVARDLSDYERLSGSAAVVRSSIRDGRMPPDLAFDPTSSAIFTAWIDGQTPP